MFIKQKSPFKYEKPDNSQKLWEYGLVIACLIYGFYLFCGGFIHHDAIKFGYYMPAWSNSYFNSDDSINKLFSRITPIGFKLVYFCLIKLGLSIIHAFQINAILASCIFSYFTYKLIAELSGKYFTAYIGSIIVILFLSLDGSLFSGTPKNFGYLFLVMWLYFFIIERFTIVSIISLLLPLFYPFWGLSLLLATIAYALTIKERKISLSGRLSINHLLSIMTGLILSLALYVSKTAQTGQIIYNPNIDITGFHEANQYMLSGNLYQKIFLNQNLSISSLFPLYASGSVGIISAILSMSLIIAGCYILLFKKKLLSTQNRIFTNITIVSGLIYCLAFFSLFQFYLPSVYLELVIKMFSPIFIIIYAQKLELKAKPITLTCSIFISIALLYCGFSSISGKFYKKLYSSPIISFINDTHPKTTIAGLGGEIGFLSLQTERNIYYNPEAFISFEPNILSNSINRMGYINEGLYSGNDNSKLLLLINASRADYILAPKDDYKISNQFLASIGNKFSISNLLDKESPCLKAESKYSLLYSSSCLTDAINQPTNRTKQP